MRRRSRTRAGLVPRSFLTTLSVALVLAAAVASHSAVAASHKHGGPVAEAVASRSAVVIEAEIAGPPRQLKVAGPCRGGPLGSPGHRVYDHRQG